MAAKKQGSEKRSAQGQVGIRLYPAELERLQKASEAAGLTHAEYVRRLILGRHVISQTDAALIRELRRIGGIAIMALRTRGMAEEGRRALADIRRAITFLSEPTR